MLCANAARRLLQRLGSLPQNLLKEHEMRKEVTSKGVGVFAAAIALPLAVIRRVIHLPTALVDMMEKHGAGK
jgi:hypothetical protein